MAPSVALPDDVLTALQGAVWAVDREARRGARATVEPRILRAAQTALRVNGQSYRDGLVNVLNAAGIDTDRLRERQRGDTGQVEAEGDRECNCESCDDAACSGDCDSCDDHDCSEHYSGHSAYACCGYCPECDSHQGDSADEVCDRGHCHDCNHVCRDY